MKKYVTKAAVAGVLSLLVSTTMAQEKNKKPLKEGEVKVMIVKDENGNRTEVNESFSLEEEEGLNALLQKYGVEWKIEDQEFRDIKQGESIRLDVEVDEETDGDEVKRDVRIVKVSNDNSSTLNKVKEVEVKEIGEGEIRKIIKLKDNEGRLKVLVLNEDDLKRDEEKIFDAKDGQRYVLHYQDIEKDMNGEESKLTEIKTMVFVTSKSGELNQDMLDELPTEIEESKLINMPVQDLKLYPNPSNGYFSMKFKTEKPTDLKLSITDVKGAKVYQKELTQFEGTFQEDYDLSDQESGVYFFNIDAEGERSSHRVLVQ